MGYSCWVQCADIIYTGMRGFMRSFLIAAVAAVLAFQAQADPRDALARARERGVAPDLHIDRVHERVSGSRFTPQGRGALAQARLLPLESVLSNVSRSIPGHHIGVDGPYQQGGRWVYRIKWLTPDGRVIIVIADAESGQILGTRGGG